VKKQQQDQASTKNDRAAISISTNLPIVHETVATGSVARSYAYYRERFGRSDIPGILKCFATHPPLLDQMIALASSLLFAEGHLPRRVKEMIATYVSALNDCPYCLDSHASFLRSQGGSDELLSALSNGNLESSSISANERQLLTFALKVTNESYKVTPDDIHQLTTRAGTSCRSPRPHTSQLSSHFSIASPTPSACHRSIAWTSTQTRRI